MWDSWECLSSDPGRWAYYFKQINLYLLNSQYVVMNTPEVKCSLVSRQTCQLKQATILARWDLSRDTDQSDLSPSWRHEAPQRYYYDASPCLATLPASQVLAQCSCQGVTWSQFSEGKTHWLCIYWDDKCDPQLPLSAMLSQPPFLRLCAMSGRPRRAHRGEKIEFGIPDD